MPFADRLASLVPVHPIGGSGIPNCAGPAMRPKRGLGSIFTIRVLGDLRVEDVERIVNLDDVAGVSAL
jgi:hypothetical protein